jgi:hypothetical protein
MYTILKKEHLVHLQGGPFLSIRSYVPGSICVLVSPQEGQYEREIMICIKREKGML